MLLCVLHGVIRIPYTVTYILDIRLGAHHKSKKYGSGNIHVYVKYGAYGRI